MPRSPRHHRGSRPQPATAGQPRAIFTPPRRPPATDDTDRDGRPGVEFSWQGSDEGDDVSGRGWAALNPDGKLEGHIYFHLGDDSAFRAERLNGVVR